MMKSIQIIPNIKLTKKTGKHSHKNEADGNVKTLHNHKERQPKEFLRAKLMDYLQANLTTDQEPKREERQQFANIAQI